MSRASPLLRFLCFERDVAEQMSEPIVVRWQWWLHVMRGDAVTWADGVVDLLRGRA